MAIPSESERAGGQNMQDHAKALLGRGYNKGAAQPMESVCKDPSWKESDNVDILPTQFLNARFSTDTEVAETSKSVYRELAAGGGANASVAGGLSACLELASRSGEGRQNLLFTQQWLAQTCRSTVSFNKIPTMDPGIEAELPSNWDPEVLASFVQKHGTDTVTAVGVGQMVSGSTRGSSTEQGLQADNFLRAAMGGNVPAPIGVLVHAGASAGGGSSTTQGSMLQGNQTSLDISGGEDNPAVFATRWTPHHSLVQNKMKAQHLMRAWTILGGDDVSRPDLDLAARIDFGQACADPKKQGPEGSALVDVQVQSSDAIYAMKRAFGIHSNAGPLSINTSPVLMGEGVPISLGIDATVVNGKLVIAPAVERTGAIPLLLKCRGYTKHAVEQATFRSSQTGECAMLTTAKGGQICNVNQYQLEYDSSENDDAAGLPGVHVLAGVQLDVSNGTLSLKGRFVRVERAQIVPGSTEWDGNPLGIDSPGSPIASRGSSPLRSVRTPSTSSHVSEDSASIKQSAAHGLCMGKASSRQKAFPYHWVMVGAQLVAKRNVLAIRGKYALLQYISAAAGP